MVSLAAVKGPVHLPNPNNKSRLLSQRGTEHTPLASDDYILWRLICATTHMIEDRVPAAAPSAARLLLQQMRHTCSTDGTTPDLQLTRITNMQGSLVLHRQTVITPQGNGKFCGADQHPSHRKPTDNPTQTPH
jgi:hypothetical protein